MALRKKDGFKGQRLIVIPESIRRILIENPITNSLYLSDIGYYDDMEGKKRAAEALGISLASLYNKIK